MTADCKSAGTPNGRLYLAIAPERLAEDFIAKTPERLAEDFLIRTQTKA